MSIFDTTIPLNTSIATVTASLYWEVPTDIRSWLTAHTDDLDLVAVLVDANGRVMGEANSYNTELDGIRHSGENVNGHGKRGAPREAVFVNLQQVSPDASAIFFVVRVINGAGLHHSQNSRLTICADNSNLHVAEINCDTRVRNMHSAILGALLRSPAGAWHYAEQMITSVSGYTNDIVPAVQSAYTQLTRA